MGRVWGGVGGEVGESGWGGGRTFIGFEGGQCGRVEPWRSHSEGFTGTNVGLSSLLPFYSGTNFQY